MSTLEDVARSIIAGTGNDSPTTSQITAMEAWIAAEKPLYNLVGDAYSNNPLNVSKGNLDASIATGRVPSNIQYSIPENNAQPGNPILQFPDLATGLVASVAALNQPFAKGIYALFSKPQDISIAQLHDKLNNPNSANGELKWGTGPLGNPPGGDLVWPGKNISIPGSQSGEPGSDNGPGTPGAPSEECIPPKDALDIAGAFKYISCTTGKQIQGVTDQLTGNWTTTLEQIQKDYTKASFLVVGILLVLVGVAVFLVEEFVSVKKPTINVDIAGALKSGNSNERSSSSGSSSAAGESDSSSESAS